MITNEVQVLAFTLFFFLSRDILYIYIRQLQTLLYVENQVVRYTALVMSQRPRARSRILHEIIYCHAVRVHSSDLACSSLYYKYSNQSKVT